MFLVLLGAAWYDGKEHRIPNWWLGAAFLCGLAVKMLGAQEGRAAAACAGYLFRILTGVAVLFPLFLFRMIGAGDIKLIALMAGFLGFGSGLWAIACGCFAGAILSLVKLLVQRNLYQRLTYLFVYFRRMFQTKEIVPYYRADRDGYGVVIPLACCLLAGYVWYLFVS